MKSLDIAKDIAYLCKKEKIDFTNTKIQKLVYLFVGFCLINDIDEINNIDEPPHLWPFGPVFPKVHKNYDSLIKKHQGTEIISTKNAKVIKILEETVKKWGIVSAGKLSTWSHLDDSPWDVVYKSGASWNTKIDLIYLKIYFENNVENVI